jgi:chemotaxis protein histidine kinase CheA
MSTGGKTKARAKVEPMPVDAGSDAEDDDDGDDGDGAAGEWNIREKGVFTPSGSRLLKQWFLDHVREPYPTDGEKRTLALRVRVSYEQVSAWFINARGRLWEGFLEGLLAGRLTQSHQVARGSDDLRAAVVAAAAAKKMPPSAKLLAALEKYPHATQQQQQQLSIASTASSGNQKKQKKQVSSAKNKSAKMKQDDDESDDSDEYDEEDDDEDDESAVATEDHSGIPTVERKGQRRALSAIPAASMRPVRLAAQKAVERARKAAKEEEEEEEEDEEEEEEDESDKEDEEQHQEAETVQGKKKKSDKGQQQKKKCRGRKVQTDDATMSDDADADAAEVAEAEELAQEEEPLPEQDEGSSGEEEQQQHHADMKPRQKIVAFLSSSPTDPSLLRPSAGGGGGGGGGVSAHVGVPLNRGGHTPLLTGLTGSCAFNELTLTPAQRMLLHSSSSPSSSTFLTVPTGANVLSDSALPSGSSTPMNMSISANASGASGSGNASAIASSIGGVSGGLMSEGASTATAAGSLHLASTNYNVHHRHPYLASASGNGTGMTPPTLSPRLTGIRLGSTPPTTLDAVSTLMSNLMPLPYHQQHHPQQLGTSPSRSTNGFLSSSSILGGSGAGGQGAPFSVLGGHLVNSNPGMPNNSGAVAAGASLSAGGGLLPAHLASTGLFAAFNPSQQQQPMDFSVSGAPFFPSPSSSTAALGSTPPQHSHSHLQSQRVSAAEMFSAAHYHNNCASLPVPVGGFNGGSAAFQPQLSAQSAPAAPQQPPPGVSMTIPGSETKQQQQQQQQPRFAAFGAPGNLAQQLAAAHPAVVLARAH